MPAAAVPVVAAVVAVFCFFMAVVGGVSLWCNLPESARED